ncbi:hypothetical protein FBZ83_104198 [Azospirillum brasilense]|uniref:Uncharacterized protein n=1 Tax=Azospirillum brasilense TaxID=192 RepID=A0A560CJA8_AZOBR|nr:hypothetical protein [Azospirillum brasilense]TWA84931.1 hypothetical protein FBZ83_104198 [Azospirillum brasilense]
MPMKEPHGREGGVLWGAELWILAEKAEICGGFVAIRAQFAPQADQTPEVVGEGGETDLHRRATQADGADEQRHAHLPVGEHVLDGRAHRRAGTVGTLVWLRHRSALRLVEMHHAAAPRRRDGRLVGLRAVGAVRPHPAVEGVGVEPARQLRAVVPRRAGDDEAPDQTEPAVDGDVRLVAKRQDQKPLHHARLRVLLARLPAARVRGLTVTDLALLLPGQPLPGRFHDGGVDDLAMLPPDPTSNQGNHGNTDSATVFRGVQRGVVRLVVNGPAWQGVGHVHHPVPRCPFSRWDHRRGGLGVPLLQPEPTEVALIRATPGILIGDEAIAERWLHFGRPSAGALRRLGCTPGAGVTSGPRAPTRNQLRTYDVEPVQLTTETLRSNGAAFCRQG